MPSINYKIIFTDKDAITTYVRYKNTNSNEYHFMTSEHPLTYTLLVLQNMALYTEAE